jgi:hypothetical protein
MAITFVIGITGLNTRIDEFYPTEQAWADADLPPNVSWEHITVANEEVVGEWLAAKNEQLAAWWTPNQNDDEKAENGVIARDAQTVMDRLEAEVKESVEK